MGVGVVFVGYHRSRIFRPSKVIIKATGCDTTWGVSNAPKNKKITMTNDDNDGDGEEYIYLQCTYAMRGHRAPP